MPKLTLKFKSSVIQIYTFPKDRTICIGRRENNDIVIPNLTVSGYHAKIDAMGDSYLLTDLKSKNKTYVNGKEVSAVLLSDNDSISIGKHTVVFNLESHDRPEPGPRIDMDKTMALNVDLPLEGLREKQGYPVKEVSQTKASGVLVFVEGGEGRFELSDKPVSIGKASSNDIVVKGFLVGKVAAVIDKTPKGYSLSPRNGLAKVQVNSRAVRASVILEEFDSIKIGVSELQFFSNMNEPPRN